jgi:hypothetical protein
MVHLIKAGADFYVDSFSRLLLWGICEFYTFHIKLGSARINLLSPSLRWRILLLRQASAWCDS